MSITVQNERSTHASYVKKSRELGNRLEVISGLETELKGLIDLEKGIESERTRVEEAKRSMQILQGKIENKKIESKGMDDRLTVSFFFEGRSAKKTQAITEERSRQLTNKAVIATRTTTRECS